MINIILFLQGQWEKKNNLHLFHLKALITVFVTRKINRRNHSGPLPLKGVLKLQNQFSGHDWCCSSVEEGQRYTPRPPLLSAPPETAKLPCGCSISICGTKFVPNIYLISQSLSSASSSHKNPKPSHPDSSGRHLQSHQHSIVMVLYYLKYFIRHYAEHCFRDVSGQIPNMKYAEDNFLFVNQCYLKATFFLYAKKNFSNSLLLLS